MGEEVDRRNYLKIAGAAIGGLVIGAAAAWYGKPAEILEKTLERTVTETLERTVTETVTATPTPTPTPTPTELTQEELIRIGFRNYEKPTKPLAEPKEWTTPPSEYSDKEEIVIGTSMPFTGIFSWGATWQKLKEQWAEKINAEGGLLGIPVRTLAYDDGSDPSRAISNFTKLITVDKVDLLFSGVPTATMVPVMNAIDGYGYAPVLLSGSSDYESFLLANNGRGWDTGFEIQVPAEFFNYCVWPWVDSLPEDIKPKKAGIIYGTYSPFTIHGSAGARYFAKDIGLEVAYDEGYPAGTTDFTPMVLAARDAGSEVLLSVDTDLSPTKLILEACRAMDWQPEVFWSIEVLYPGFEDPTRPGKLQPLTYYTTVPIMHWPTWDDPPFKDTAYWVDQYTEIFNIGFPNFDSAWAPLECQILEQAVQATGSLDFEVLKKYMMEHSFYTVMGHIEFTEENFIRGLTMATGIIDGEGVEQVTWPEELATAEAVYPRPPWSEYYP